MSGESEQVHPAELEALRVELAGLRDQMSELRRIFERQEDRVWRLLLAVASGAGVGGAGLGAAAQSIMGG